MINQRKWGALLSYLSLIVNVLVKLLYTPILLRLLGQAEYGLYSLVLSIVGYLAILDFGFGSTIVRYTVKYTTEGDNKKLMGLYGTISIIYIGIGLLAFFVCFLLSFLSNSLFDASMTTEEVSKVRLMLILCGINLLFSFPLQISSSVLVAYERFVFKNGVNFLKIIIEPVITIILLYFFSMKSIAAVMVITICNLAGYLLYYIYAIKNLNFGFSFKSFDSSLVKTLLSYSTGMFLLMLFEQVQFNSGQFILGVFYGSKTIAVWGIVMIFVLNYRSMSTSVTNVFTPSFLNTVFKDDKNGLYSTIEKMTRLQAVILFFIISNFLLFGFPFIEIWAGIEYADAYYCSLIIMLPMTLSLLLEFCYMYQMACNHLLYRVVTFFSGFAVSFVVIYFIFGLTLQSFAYIISLSIILGQILMVLVYLKKSKISYVSRNLFFSLVKMLTAPVLITVLFYLISKYMYTGCFSSIPTLIGYFLVFNVILVLIVYLFSLNDVERSYLKIVKKRDINDNHL